MFQNVLRQNKSNDPFQELQNDGNVEVGSTPFSHVLNPTVDVDQVNPNQHFVNPHPVSGYVRGDGTQVDGYWRDGDGNTSIDRGVEDGGGYMQTNPDGDPFNNLG